MDNSQKTNDGGITTSGCGNSASQGCESEGGTAGQVSSRGPGPACWTGRSRRGGIEGDSVVVSSAPSSPGPSAPRKERATARGRKRRKEREGKEEEKEGESVRSGFDSVSPSEGSSPSTSRDASLEGASRSCSLGKRKRGRPPTSGLYVGLAAAKERNNKAEEEALRLEAERQFLQFQGERRATRARGVPVPDSADEGSVEEGKGKEEREERSQLRLAVELVDEVKGKVEVVEKVATTSNNLKGTYVKALKMAAISIKEGVERLGGLSKSEEARQLRREIQKRDGEIESLRRSLDDLRREIGVLREARSVPPPPPLPPSLPEALPTPPVLRPPSPLAVEESFPPVEAATEALGAMDLDAGEPLPLPRRKRELPRVREVVVFPPPPHRAPAGTRVADPLESALGPAQLETLVGTVVRQVAEILGARLEIIEARLPPEAPLRPPLKGSGGGKGGPIKSVAPLAENAPQGKKAKGKGGRKEGGTSQTPPTPVARTRGGKEGKKARPAEEEVSPPPQPTKPLVPPRTSFAEVVKRGSKQKKGGAPKPTPSRAPVPLVAPSRKGREAGRGESRPAAATAAGKGKAAPPPAPAANRKKKRAPRRPAAVVLTLQPGGSLSMAEAMTEARKKIDLKDLGIASLKVRRAITGATILEVPGEQSAPRADELAIRLAEALGDKGVRIARPVRCAELRLTGLDDSITAGEVVAAISLAGGCPEGDVKVGELRRAPSGLFGLWAKCPQTAAIKAAESGRILVGWASARIEILPPRPLQCHRCLMTGHTRGRCTAEKDRSGLCYRCGQPGHKAGGCTAAPRCPLCADLGRPAGHRFGGAACRGSAPPKKGKLGGKGGAASGPSPPTQPKGGGKKGKAGEPSPPPKGKKGAEDGEPPSPPKEGIDPRALEAPSTSGKEGLEEAMLTEL